MNGQRRWHGFIKHAVFAAVLLLGGCAKGEAVQLGQFRLKPIPKATMAWTVSPSGAAATTALTGKQFGKFVGQTNVTTNPDSAVLINVGPGAARGWWEAMEPHVRVGQIHGLDRYASRAPGVVNPGDDLKLPAPYDGVIFCGAGQLVRAEGGSCAMEIAALGMTHTINFSDQAVPRWKAIADGYVAAMRPLIEGPGA